MKNNFLSIVLLTTLFGVHSGAQANVEQTIKFVRSNNIQFGHFIFFDAFGKVKELIFPRAYLEGALKNGVFFDGSSVPGYSVINQSDLCLKADLQHIYISPWKTENSLSAYFVTSIFDFDGTPYKRSPRTILEKVTKRAKEMGYECLCGIELEFFLFKPDKDGNLIPCDGDIYCDAGTNPQMNAFKEGLLYALTHIGLQPEKVHHEVAGGQYEIVLEHVDAITMADRLLLAKHFIKMFARQHGFVASFMPKPIAGINGSGMHVHVSLKSENGNAFYDKTGPVFLSKIAQSFISNLLKRIPEINILLNTEVNSFKRLIPGYEAPVYLCCGEKNRSAAIRIPEVLQGSLEKTNGAAVRFELRSPDSECNPYLAFAALFQAGLDGIEEQVHAVPLIKENLYHADKDVLKQKGICVIPENLEKSIVLFEQSDFAKNLLGADLHAKFCEVKKNEWRSYLEQENHDPLVITKWEKHRGIC